MRVLVTRPLEDGAETARQLTAMGHDALLAPLLTVRIHTGQELALAGVQAVLATSANGVRALAARTPLRDIPIFAVGPQTAEAARQAGFIRVRSADGDAAALADAVPDWARPDAGALLHAAGEEGSGWLAPTLTGRGFQVRRELLYRVDAAAGLPPATIHAFEQGARVFADCVARAGLSMAGVIAVCISAGTASALADLAFAEVRVAHAPNQAALLDCL
jgi:uroporphyrinogen-III synthase